MLNFHIQSALCILQVLYPQIQLTMDQKYSKKLFFPQKVPKSKLEFVTLFICYTIKSATIYIVFTTIYISFTLNFISNLEMI